MDVNRERYHRKKTANRLWFLPATHTSPCQSGAVTTHQLHGQTEENSAWQQRLQSHCSHLAPVAFPLLHASSLSLLSLSPALPPLRALSLSPLKLYLSFWQVSTKHCMQSYIQLYTSPVKWIEGNVMVLSTSINSSLLLSVNRHVLKLLSFKFEMRKNSVRYIYERWIHYLTNLE